MKKTKSITAIVLQIVSTFLLIGTKGWVIGYKVNYNNSFTVDAGYNSTLFETINRYNSLREYSMGSGSSADYPSFPSILLYLLFLLMTIVVVFSVLKLTNKSIGFLNYKVMCAVSGLALLITLFLMLLPFGKAYFSFYLKHDNPGIIFIIIACMIATTLLIVLGEKSSNTDAIVVGTEGKGISNILPKKTNQVISTDMSSNIEREKMIDKNDDWANALIQYKALLDEGIITQEEFDKKKNELIK